jgi:hypothetical protein
LVIISPNCSFSACFLFSKFQDSLETVSWSVACHYSACTCQMMMNLFLWLIWHFAASTAAESTFQANILYAGYHRPLQGSSSLMLWDWLASISCATVLNQCAKTETST